MKIALAGNPNSGKTTIFNALTGSSQHVGNWPGVTVEKKDGRLIGHKNVILQDLPGIYSLSPYTPEEVVTRNYIVKDKPDVIINIVDASNIERNLYLTTQIAELGIPVIIALNMMDIAEKNGIKINIEKLSSALGCKIFKTTGTRKHGLLEVAEFSAGLQEDYSSIIKYKFSSETESALTQISIILSPLTEEKLLRYYSIKFFERDPEIIKEFNINSETMARIEDIIRCCEKLHNDDSESIITNERYLIVTKAVRNCIEFNENNITVSERIDNIITHRIYALPIFAVIMFLIYFISITFFGSMSAKFISANLFGKIVPEYFGDFLINLKISEWLYSLIMNGIIAGVGAVISFLPQMLLLFACLAILEDCGYMARIAFVLDKLFKRFGLSGKSFIPMLISTGCGVPGIMVSRSIESQNDRRMTMITTTFMPCGAKLPVISLIAGTMFPDAAWIAPATYFIGIATIIISGIILKKLKMFSSKPSPFVMELPAYHMPRALSVLRTTFDRGFSFVRKAGSIVLIAAVLIWFLSNFNLKLQIAETKVSILSMIGRFISPLFIPLGWGNWQSTVATISGFFAKENIVGTFGVLYNNQATDSAWPELVTSFTKLSAVSFLCFNLYSMPCIAAMRTLHKELMSIRWSIFAFAYQFITGYTLAFLIYQIGMLCSGYQVNVWTIAAILLIVFIFYLLIKKPSYKKRVS